MDHKKNDSVMDQAINFDNITKSFGNNTVLKDVSGIIEQGKITVLLGPSGSGKSTLLRCMNLLEKPEVGSIRIGGVNIMGSDLSAKGLRILRRNIGMVFQHFHLFPNMTVLENISFSLEKVLGLSKGEAKNISLLLLERVGLLEKENAFPERLSGGQKQRVAIARSLAMNPKIMLFDEPTSALDPEMVKEVLDVIKNLSCDSKVEEKMTMMIVTHEMQFAREIADEIWFLDQGKIIEKSAPDIFFSNPKTKRAQKFLSKIL